MYCASEAMRQSAASVYESNRYNSLNTVLALVQCLTTIFWSRQDAKQAMHIQQTQRIIEH